MGKINWEKTKSVVKSWRVGDYIRQFSIVAAGIIVTFWGSDWITERGRQKEVRATMQLVVEELQHNREELRVIKGLLDIDIHMSELMISHDMEISEIHQDTIWKYGKFFTNMASFNYSTDALDVLKGSSLMQYIADKRLLQDMLRTYYKLGKIQTEINAYYDTKSDILLAYSLSAKKKNTLMVNWNFITEVADMMENDGFFNFVIMVPGFLDWEDFALLDELLSKQIHTLEQIYK